MRKNVVITASKFQDRLDWVRSFLESRGCTLDPQDVSLPLSEDRMIELLQCADGLITALEPVTARVLDNTPHLKVISTAGVGYDHVDIEAASRRGIAVCNCAGCNNYGVAELAFGMMIGLSRSILVHDRKLRAGDWDRIFGPELWGKTLGIVGLGRVGKSVALLGRAFGMRLLATDIVWDTTFANEYGISYVPLEQLLEQSDYVSLHVPLDDNTRHLIDERALDRMKPSAYLINLARGSVVKEAALVRALRDRRIAGAGLDVFEIEPHPDCPYLDLDNVILTPHIGGSSNEARDRSIYLGLINVTNVLNGLPPHCQVN